MALRFSKQFWEEVKSKITKFERQEKSDIPAPDEINTTRSLLAEKILWGQHYHLRDALPVEWLIKVRGVDFKFQYQTETRVSSLYVRCVMADYIIVPPGTPTYRPDVHMTSAALAKYNEEEFPELVDLREAHRLLTLKEEVSDKWGRVFNSLRAVLTAYPSASMAFTAHPALKVFVPNEYLGKLTTPKRRPPVLDLDVDVQSLVAAAVEAKLRQYGDNHES